MMFQQAHRMLVTCTGIELMNESRDEPRQECQYSWGSHHKTCKAWYVYMTLETRKERRFQRVKAVYVTYTIGGMESDYRQEKRQECPNSKQGHNTCTWNGNAVETDMPYRDHHVLSKWRDQPGKKERTQCFVRPLTEKLIWVNHINSQSIQNAERNSGRHPKKKTGLHGQWTSYSRDSNTGGTANPIPASDSFIISLHAWHVNDS